MKYKGDHFSIDIDIVSDLKEWAFNMLVDAGFNNVKRDSALHQYCNMRLRRLDPKPRTVLVSKELRCPDACKDGYAYFQGSVEKGNDLLPFMSKSILDADAKDKMIFDWGFFHFHLNKGSDTKDPRFIERSDYLLIAYVDINHDDKMYFLQIRPHDVSVWTEQDLVRILADNWPEIVERYRVKGAVSLTETVTDEVYRDLRKSNVTTLVDLKDGRVFLGPNLGLNTAGTSARASLHYNSICNNAVLLEKGMGELADQIGRAIKMSLNTQGLNFKLRLVRPGNNDYLFKVEQHDLLLRFFYWDGRPCIAVGDTIDEIEAAIREGMNGE